MQQPPGDVIPQPRPKGSMYMYISYYYMIPYQMVSEGEAEARSSRRGASIHSRLVGTIYTGRQPRELYVEGL